MIAQAGREEFRCRSHEVSRIERGHALASDSHCRKPNSRTQALAVETSNRRQGKRKMERKMEENGDVLPYIPHDSRGISRELPTGGQTVTAARTRPHRRPATRAPA